MEATEIPSVFTFQAKPYFISELKCRKEYEWQIYEAL